MKALFGAMIDTVKEAACDVLIIAIAGIGVIVAVVAGDDDA